MDLLVTEIIVDLPFEFFSNKQHYHPDGLNLGTCVFVYVYKVHMRIQGGSGR